MEIVKRFAEYTMSESFKYGLAVVVLLGWSIWQGYLNYQHDQKTDMRLTRVEKKLDDCNKDKENILLDRSQLSKYP